MKSLLEVLALSTAYLQKKGIKRARREAEKVLSDALAMNRLELYLQFERPLSEEELQQCREKIVRRGKGEPVQYIHGSVDFYGCKIAVNGDVLIPRQETELLVDKAAKTIALEEKKEDFSGKVLWDLCCGSGCIGIALKKRFPSLQVALSDLSPQALAIARKNAISNGVDVFFLQGDLLVPFEGKKVHFFFCNPPYIAEEEYMQLECEVKCFEPKMALVAGKSGLEFYERLAFFLKGHMHFGGKGWLEIGHKQGQTILELFSSHGWSSCRVERDLSGQERFFFLE